MSIDGESDWDGLRAAGDVVRQTLKVLRAHVRAGVSTAELDAVAAEVFAQHGARSAPALVYGFPGTVLTRHGSLDSRRAAGSELFRASADGHLTEGLVIAIEPIISAGAGTVYEDADGWTIRTRNGSLAAHYENTVVITKGEPIIVTAAA